jgi:hypothetical protein
MGRPRGSRLRSRLFCSSRESQAVGYCRRSTDRQEQSIPDQKAAIETYAKEHGITLVRFYIDDAISGTSTKGRKAFEQLVEDAKRASCNFGVVLVYDVKRFGRVDNDEAGYYRYILKTHGVEVLYCSENFTGDRTDDLLRPVKQWQAREESKDLSKVSIRGLLSRAASPPPANSRHKNIGAATGGWWMGGAPPYGFDLAYESRNGEFLFYLRYMRDGTRQMLDSGSKTVRILGRGEIAPASRLDRCKLAPSEPDRVKTIQRVFQMYVKDGLGFRSIADRLNQEKVLPPRGPEWSPIYSGYWSMVAVRGILANPTYTGDMVWNRRTDGRFHRIMKGQAVERKGIHRRMMEWNPESDWIVTPAAHEGLVSKQTWQSAREMLHTKPDSRRQRGTNQRTGTPISSTPNPSIANWNGPRARFMLSGLMNCVRCGSRYEGRVQYGSRPANPQVERKRWYVYGCGAYIRYGRSVCPFGAVPQVPIEEAVLRSVFEFYQKYTGPKGSDRIRAAVGLQSDRGQEEFNERRKALQAVVRKIDQTIRNLLDNISAINRELVDQRLLELRQQRESVEAELSVVDHINLSQSQMEEVADESRQFVNDLRAILQGGVPTARHLALRRCISALVVDSSAGHADIWFRAVPNICIGSDYSATEFVRVCWG